MVYIGKVISTTDKSGGDNIYTYINGIDGDEKCTNEKKTFPLLPKYIQTKPLYGEYVVIIAIATNEHSTIQRFYVGPVISQMQFMDGQPTDESLSTTNLSTMPRTRNIEYSRYSEGSLGKHDDIAIYGRKGTDVLLGSNDLRIRCGSRINDKDNLGKTFKFNTIDSAFMQMKYYEKPLKVEMNMWDDSTKSFMPNNEYYTDSVAVLSAQNIALVGSDERLSKGKSGMITDDTMAEILSESHPMIYGDELVKILIAFRDAINTHVHDWGPSPANDHPTDELNSLNQIDFGKMLSNNIRIG